MPPKSKPQKVFRLTDMLVEEVSVVDRAANKHKFLIVKRDPTMPPTEDTEVTANPDGTFSNESAASEATPVEKLALSDADKSAALGAITGAITKLTALANEVKGASVGKGAGDIASVRSRAAAAVSGVTSLGGGATPSGGEDSTSGKPKGTPETDKGAKSSTQKSEPRVLESEERDDLAKATKTAAGALQEIAAMLAVDEKITDHSFCWKVEDAIRMLQQHMKLEAVLGAVTKNAGEDDGETDDNAPAADPEDVTKGKLSAQERARFEGQIAGMQSILAQINGSGAKPSETPAEETPDDDAVAKLAKSLDDAKGKFEQLTKQLRDREKRIAQLESAPSQPRGGSPEGSTPTAPEPTGWPADMAAP